MDARTQNYNGIDLFKFLFALCVVACHVHPYDTQITSVFSIYGFLNTVLNSAVPFFFIANGFLLAKRIRTPFWDQKNFGVVYGQLKKYLLLYLIWTVAYLPVTVYYYVISKSSPLSIAYNFVDGLLFKGEHWYSWHLWYLYALIWVSVMISFLIKSKMSEKVWITISVVLFVFAYFYGHFLSSVDFLPIKVFREIFGATGRQFTAPLYLMIGFLLSRRRFSALMGIILTALGIALSPLFPSTGSGYYSEPNLVLVASGVFIIALSLNFKNSKLFFFFRTSSTVMYFSHLLVYVFVSLVFLGEMRDGLVMYLIVTAVCLIISVPIFSMERRKNSVVKLLFLGRWKK